MVNNRRLKLQVHTSEVEHERLTIYNKKISFTVAHRFEDVLVEIYRT